jgi:hypothetical protein
MAHELGMLCLLLDVPAAAMPADGDNVLVTNAEQSLVPLALGLQEAEGV